MSIRTFVDDALDRTVVPGFSRLGPLIRSRVAGWDALPSLAGRTVLVTGANGGLGLAASHELARLGASLRMLVRDAERGERARAEVVAASGNDDVSCELVDVSLRSSVRAFCDRFDEPVHVLVHNAGVLPAERRETAEGVEVAFATNVVGPHLLTRLLRDRLVEHAPARVIWVSSGGMYTQRVCVDDLEFREGAYDGTTAYARTKRAEVILSERWAEELAGTGVVSNAMHPGWAATPGIKDAIPGFSTVMGPLLRSPGQGADTIVWLASAEEAAQESGGFFCDRRRRPTHRLARTRETRIERDELWRAVEELAGRP
jgi:dehydrogenase/reductase SDR family member 12